mgnify:CR=1 FL=1
MPHYRVSYEVEADDPDSALDALLDYRTAVTVTLLDEPEPDCADEIGADEVEE